jgi:hypothetical protein
MYGHLAAIGAVYAMCVCYSRFWRFQKLGFELKYGFGGKFRKLLLYPLSYPGKIEAETACFCDSCKLAYVD